MSRYDFIAVYIVASSRNGTIYTGVTSDLVSRAQQHRTGEFGGFSAKHGCKLLVWYELHHEIGPAIERETRIKGWRRAWKLALIEGENPQWLDLAPRLLLPQSAWPSLKPLHDD